MQDGTLDKEVGRSATVPKMVLIWKGEFLIEFSLFLVGEVISEKIDLELLVVSMAGSCC